jgi:hypothetical protein
MGYMRLEMGKNLLGTSLERESYRVSFSYPVVSHHTYPPFTVLARSFDVI